MAVAYLSSDTLTGIRTPLCWTPLDPVHNASRWSAQLLSGDHEVPLRLRRSLLTSPWSRDVGATRAVRIGDSGARGHAGAWARR